MNTATARHKARRFALFNHKGGVGKTTLTVNISAALAAQGKRVLLVDSDPQCNLTSYLVEDSVVNKLLDQSDFEDGGTLWSALKPITEATGEVRLIEPLERFDNIYLLPGDVQLSKFEQDLNQLWNECLQRRPRGFRGTTGLSLLVNAICGKLNIDYVFYDSGPNIGPLNRVILLDCDYFIIPAACDLFSVRALKTLGYTLDEWIRDWDIINKLAPDNTYLIPGRPKLMGYIPQQFRVYRGEVTTGYSGYLARIERHIISDVVAVLRKIDSSLASNSLSYNKLGLIKSFSSLATASQTQGVPIKDVNAGTAEQRVEAEKAFTNIAKKIIQRSGS